MFYSHCEGPYKLMSPKDDGEPKESVMCDVQNQTKVMGFFYIQPSRNCDLQHQSNWICTCPRHMFNIIQTLYKVSKYPWTDLVRGNDNLTAETC